MGGSGGGSFDFSSSKDANSSEKIFQSATDEAKRAESQSSERNVFISFDVEEKGKVELLRSQAKDDRFPFGFRDYSVKEPFEEKWKTEVKNLISLTSAVIVMIGKNTHNSEAVDWEIREAHRQNKKVIGVRIYRDDNDPVPKALTENNDSIINWDTKEIARLLEK